MRRLWAAGTAIAMCLALGGLPALAQEPSGSPSEHPLPLVTSGTGTACTTVDRGTRGTSDGLVQAAEEARGQTFECVMTMSDPRVSGIARGTFNDGPPPSQAPLPAEAGE